MTKLKPHGLFSVWSPDEVAEALEGVGPEIYRKIWNEIVPIYDKWPRSEVPDDFSKRCLAKWWYKFDPEEQAMLNMLAKEHEGEYK